jgi:hypothetical protein
MILPENRVPFLAIMLGTGHLKMDFPVDKIGDILRTEEDTDHGEDAPVCCLLDQDIRMFCNSIEC